MRVLRSSFWLQTKMGVTITMTHPRGVLVASLALCLAALITPVLALQRRRSGAAAPYVPRAPTLRKARAVGALSLRSDPFYAFAGQGDRPSRLFAPDMAARGWEAFSGPAVTADPQASALLRMSTSQQKSRDDVREWEGIRKVTVYSLPRDARLADNGGAVVRIELEFEAVRGDFINTRVETLGVTSDEALISGNLKEHERGLTREEQELLA